MVFAAENPGLFIFMEKELRHLVRHTLGEMLLSESILRELDVDWEHVNDRYDERLQPSVLEVGFEAGTPDGKATTREVVGTHSIPASVKADIREKLNKLSDKRVRLNKGKTYGILLSNLFINPNEVSYYSAEDKVKSKGKTLIYIVTFGESYSVGNQVWVATDDSGSTQVKTLMFRRSYYTPDNRWDMTIKDMNKILPDDLKS